MIALPHQRTPAPRCGHACGSAALLMQWLRILLLDRPKYVRQVPPPQRCTWGLGPVMLMLGQA
jgi:hypothetical protein